MSSATWRVGKSPRDAARKAMTEVTGPVIAIALVLCAVFVPTAFMAGISGQFYKQFALTIAVSTVISAFNSLTLSPALCAILLKPHGHGTTATARSAAAAGHRPARLAWLPAFLSRLRRPARRAVPAGGHGKSTRHEAASPTSTGAFAVGLFVVGGVAGWFAGRAGQRRCWAASFGASTGAFDATINGYGSIVQLFVCVASRSSCWSTAGSWP